MAFTQTDYELPNKGGGSYLNFKEEGKHQFRFMGDVYTYNRYWKGKKPFVYTDKSQIPADVDVSTFTGKPQIEHAWAVVAILKDKAGKPEQIGILEIPQSTVQKQLMSFYQDKDYGDFCNYDIVVTTETKPKVTYTVLPKPAKAATKDEVEMYEGFEGKDLKAHYAVEKFNSKLFEDVDPSELPF